MRKIEIAAIVQGLAPLLRAFADRLAAVEGKERGLDGRPGEIGPRGPEGPEGQPGRDGRDGVIGRSGADGLDGKDGVNGLPGIDGKDGLGFDDLAVLHDGERSFTIRFARGDQVKEFPFSIPVSLYRGVYAEGTAYVRGDDVTWAGSEWHCHTPTTTKPGDGSKAWQLKVKRGRDGKDGPEGRAGERGAKGERGDPGKDYR